MAGTTRKLSGYQCRPGEIELSQILISQHESPLDRPIEHSHRRFKNEKVNL